MLLCFLTAPRALVKTRRWQTWAPKATPEQGTKSRRDNCKRVAYIPIHIQTGSPKPNAVDASHWLTQAAETMPWQLFTVSRPFHIIKGNIKRWDNTNSSEGTANPSLVRSCFSQSCSLSCRCDPSHIPRILISQNFTSFPCSCICRATVVTLFRST